MKSDEFIGVIADTHSLVREEVLSALAGASKIIHAGDIGRESVIRELEHIAPVIAIKGNIDTAPWSQQFPHTETVQIFNRHGYVIHNVRDIDFDPTDQFDVVISGHSHKPMNIKRDGVLYFNPGSAGPRRFSLPIAVGKLRFEGGEIVGEILELAI